MFIRKLTKEVITTGTENVVRTESGLVRGFADDGTVIFRGIPYAKAARFHMPEKPDPWDGIRDAFVYGPACPEIMTVMPADNFNVPHMFYPQREDCQVLNIWTRHPDAAAKRPVMVWLHGGGFSTGSGIEHFAYDGQELAAFADVVVVTVNHRLNVLGHLNLAAYGPEYEHSANLGLADLVAALEWIKRNIAAFGGDPDCVTVFGQSGGGGKVAALLQMPSAEGLFHRAVIESGILYGVPEATQEETRKDAENVLKALDITPEHVKDIETVPFWKLGAAVNEAFSRDQRFHFGPVPEGTYYPGDCFHAGFGKWASGIPVIVGSNLGEFSNSFMRHLGDDRRDRWSVEEKDKLLREQFGEKTDEVLAAFRKAYPGRSDTDVVYTDTLFRRGALSFVDCRLQNGCTAQTYNYLFDLDGAFYGGVTAWHNAEIPYVFHNAAYIEPSYRPGITEPMQDLMASAWASFAASGKPSAKGMPEWIPASAGHPQAMIFGENTGMREGHDTELMKVLPSCKLHLSDESREEAAILFAGGPRELV